MVYAYFDVRIVNNCKGSLFIVKGVSLKVVAAVGIGLGYYLLTNLLGYFGLVVNIPAQPIAILPPLLLTLLSVWILFKSR